MPIFEYQCSQCDHRFETIVRTATEAVICPHCQSSALKKQLSIFSSRSTGAQETPPGSGCGCTPQTCGCH